MKYKVRFYREYGIETTEPADALKMARGLFVKDLGEQKIGAGFIYEIRFISNSGQRYKHEEKVFNGEIF